MKHLSTARFSVAIFSVFLVSTVIADEAIDEIIVTADFRERNASDMPTSVTVMDAGFIADNAVQHFEELINLVPNLNWSGDGHRARYFQIRGVGELEQYQGAPNPSIGFLIDDIDFSGIGTIATLFDMQSVEVLRGSQGSRYGANALGGLIYMRSTMPTSKRNGRVSLTAGSDDAVSAGIAFGGALNASESTSFRVSAHTHTSNGFRDNTYLNRDDTNDRDETTLRARLRLQPSDRLETNVSIIYAKVDDGYDAFSLDNSYTMLSDKPGKDAQESIGASMRLDWDDFGNGSLTAITSLAISDIDFSYDADWGNDDSWVPVLYDYISTSTRDRKTVSQEFRYITDNWLFGIYALNLREDIGSLIAGDYYDPFYDWADSTYYPFDSAYESTNVSLFAQYNRDLSDATRIEAGLRLERRTTDYNDSDGLVTGPSDSLWGGELSISHDFSGDVTGFMAVSKGYKADGFNLGIVPDNLRVFDSETMWTVETGIKSALLDDSLLLNASVFHAWRKDQQARMSFQLFPNDPASFGFATINVDEAKTYGLEADLRWQPVEAFEAYLNVGLLYGTIEKVSAELDELNYLVGREHAHAPRLTLAAGMSYQHESGAFARLDATSKNDFYFDVSHSQVSRSFELLNARVGYQSDDWTLALWARNLTDEDYAVRGFYFGNEPPDFPATLYTRFGDPRQVGVTIERRFH